MLARYGSASWARDRWPWVFSASVSSSSARACFCCSAMADVSWRLHLSGRCVHRVVESSLDGGRPLAGAEPGVQTHVRKRHRHGCGQNVDGQQQRTPAHVAAAGAESDQPRHQNQSGLYSHRCERGKPHGKIQPHAFERRVPGDDREQATGYKENLDHRPAHAGEVAKVGRGHRCLLQHETHSRGAMFHLFAAKRGRRYSVLTKISPKRTGSWLRSVPAPRRKYNIGAQQPSLLAGMKYRRRWPPTQNHCRTDHVDRLIRRRTAGPAGTRNSELPGQRRSRSRPPPSPSPADESSERHRRRSAHRHAYSDLLGPLHYRVRNHAIDSNPRENQRDDGEDGGQQ